MFKCIAYKHQKCAIFFNFISSFIFELSCFIILINSEYGEDYIYAQKIWLLPITFIFFLLLVIIYSYAFSKIKLFMDLNWISLSKLFIFYSILGFFINIIICIILTFIKCNETFKKYFCYINEEDNYYIENILSFLKSISIIFSDDNKSDLIFIICIILLQILVNSLYYFCLLSILKNLYPEYYFFSKYINNIFALIISPIYRRISEGYYFSERTSENKILLARYILFLIGYVCSFIGFLIYLEIIELNFCGFNYYLRRNITQRSIEDTNMGINFDEEQNECLIYDKNSNRIS